MACCCCISILAIIAIALGLLKLYLKLTTGWDKSSTCLIGKTAIVTGANTGIGYYTALDFAKRGARVILACRNKEKAEKARNRIVQATGNQNVVVKLIDMASLSSVREFAKDINATETNLHILVNNAGAGGLGNHITKDGLQLLMQVNYFSSFLLTNLLLDLLKKTAPSRIINVSSTLSHYSKLNINDLNAHPEGFMSQTINYANSKVCNVLFTNELARRLDGTYVTTNSLHPGVVVTEIYRRMPKLMLTIFMFFARIFYKNAEEGAQTTIYLSVSKDVENISGKYFEDCKVAAMAKEAQDVSFAKKLWEESEKLVKLKTE